MRGPFRDIGPIPLLCAALALSGCGGSGSAPEGAGETADGSAPAPETTAAASGSFVNFESGQVRPMALSAGGERLLVTNTPNGTLDTFSVSADGLQPEHSVPVGMEPVAVALFGDEQADEQAWVVNHLSDSISIVDLAAEPPRVIDTLLVGDEPRDIVFAGADASLAFVTTAHRGQNGPDDEPVDAELFTPSVGRADVWVFDARARGDSLGGDPLSVLSMFGDTPRALTVSPDGGTVYAAVMHSGNRTTTLGEDFIAKPGPVQSGDGALQPDTGLIVGFDGSRWRDATGSAADLNGIGHDSRVRFTLPDHDVFAIEASDTPAVVDRYSGVGTTLFNMATNPLTGVVYVSNTEANNLVRFEGEGDTATTVRGNVGQSRITVIDGRSVAARDLNKHLDHGQASATGEQRRLAIAQPLGMAVSADGGTLYVAGFGSRKVALYDTAELESDGFAVAASGQIPLDAGGPTAVILDEARERLYVSTRFDNGVAVIDTRSGTAIGSVGLYNPEPPHVVEGRPFLYDAGPHSSHGDASCASCHVFGDVDALAWDLGNPDEVVTANPNPFVNVALTPAGSARFHPMKGPMTTQSLRGLAGNGPMHWRGDRTGRDAADGESLEHAAFRDFNIAFPQLLGRASELSETEMSRFADFALGISYPPNPIRALDNSLTASQAEGRRIYLQDVTTGEAFTCNDCHVLDPPRGRFGTDGRSSVEGDDISQEFKVPHLRNVYQKVGKFGNTGRFAGSDTEFGEQIKGFGLMHDGNMDTVENFLRADVFSFDTDADTDDLKRRQVVEFVMVMDTELAPVVGQQVTVDADSGDDTHARLDLLLERAAVTTPRPECDLVAKGVVENVARGFLLNDAGTFDGDKAGETYGVERLKDLARRDGGAVTFTCVPPGSGVRMGIDRDEDGTRDGDADEA